MTYSPDTKDKVCQLIAEGKSLRQIGDMDGMPTPSTVCLWALTDETFSEQYARAREIQAELQADELIAIADEATNETVQVAKLRIDTRKWTAAKLRPKKYGDKVTQEVTGKDGEDLIPKTDNRELAKAIVSVLGKAKLDDA